MKTLSLSPSSIDSECLVSCQPKTNPQLAITVCLINLRPCNGSRPILKPLVVILTKLPLWVNRLVELPYITICLVLYPEAFLTKVSAFLVQHYVGGQVLRDH